MRTVVEIFKWIGAHANKVSSFIRAIIYMGVALNWTDLNDTQIGSILLVVELGLAMFTETNTVSKVRVGERIDQEVARQTGTGTFRATSGLAILLAVGLMAGCAGKTGAVLIRADDVLHDSLQRVKQAGDKLCAAKAPVLSVETCKTFYGALTPALEAGDAFNRVTVQQRFDSLVDLAAKITRLMEVVRAIPLQHRGAMESNLKVALSTAAATE